MQPHHQAHPGCKMKQALRVQQSDTEKQERIGRKAEDDVLIDSFNIHLGTGSHLARVSRESGRPGQDGRTID